MNRWTIAAVVGVLLAGCASKNPQVKEVPEGNQSVASIDEAGSVHIAVLAVTSWEEVKVKMRPNLKIDDKDLRNQAIPVTFALLDKYLDILRLQAAIAPSTVKTTSTSTTTTETGKDDASKTESTTTKAPGEARSTPSAAALAAGSAPGIAASGVSAINSSLTARAMASFVQDVQALNAEVDSAARRTGYEPYLVRVQVTVMPRRRHLGYDVYSNLSFFGYQGKFDPETGQSDVRKATSGAPFVVPLLSSDSIETAQRAQSIEALRDVGLALDLVKGFGAAGFAISSQKDRQQALQGLDVNSVLTLGRLSDNTVRVRFGAAFDPGGGFAVHPRTNTISVLVFFPKEAQQVRVVSRTAWTHVLDGTSLERAPERYDARLKPIEEQWRHLGLSVRRLKEIDELPFEGDYAAFEREMDRTLTSYCERPDTGVAWEPPSACGTQEGKLMHGLAMVGHEGEKERTYAYVWSHLLSVLPGSRFSTTVVDLPRLQPECPVASQFVSYMEDDKGITVSLRGGKDLSTANFTAAVHWAYVAAPEEAGSSPGYPRPPAMTSAGSPASRVSASAASVSSLRKNAPPARSATDPERPVLVGPAGAMLASDAAISEDRKAATVTFASDRMEPPEWSKAKALLPIAVEVGGCRPAAGRSAAVSVHGVQLEPLLGAQSQFYWLAAKVPKKEKADAKEKSADVSLATSTTNLVLDKKSIASTTVVVDLGEKPKTAYALAAVGAVLKTALPTERSSRRPDGSFLVKSSGPVDLTFGNLIANQTVDLELRPIDERDKLGAAIKKLTFSARFSKS